MTKSKAAFLLSAQKLFDIGDKVYFWTFTFKNVYPDWWYPYHWRIFARDVGNLYGGYVCGLRVLEPHDQHGLHYHLLVNRRLSIHLIRRIAERVGMFWIHVSRKSVDIGTAHYLAKYLSKKGPRLHGVHKWGTFGCFRGVRVNDIVIESDYMNARRRIVGTRKVPIGWEYVLRRVHDIHGDRGMEACFKKLSDGKLASAASFVSPHIEITPKGGIRYFAPIPANRRIPVRCVRRS